MEPVHLSDRGPIAPRWRADRHLRIGRLAAVGQPHQATRAAMISRSRARRTSVVESAGVGAFAARWSGRVCRTTPMGQWATSESPLAAIDVNRQSVSVARKGVENLSSPQPVAPAGGESG